jgi:hypothetical protein
MGKSLYGGEEMAGLLFEHYAANTLENVGTGIKDPLRNLVYRSVGGCACVDSWPLHCPVLTCLRPSLISGSIPCPSP